ncbi:SAM-dependent methyltransferase [Streptomyces sp. NPDC001941]|uniref:SAM-dependent methyltransferase n=1 Tax=Streptomyces sp. NPDC001941 TaxID=3154659 RepID=UPI003329F9F2
MTATAIPAPSMATASPPGWAASRTDVPRGHRVYDYLLGGKDHLTPDRVLGEQLLGAAPWLATAARINRAHGVRAVQEMSGWGIGQFVDLGCGLPSPAHLRLPALLDGVAVAGVGEDARVVHVDADPVVMATARALLRTPHGTSAFLHADLTTAAALIAGLATVTIERDPRRPVLDLSRPVGVLLHDVLPYLSDAHAAALMERLRAWLPSGSVLSVTHATGDFAPRTSQILARRMAEAGLPYFPRSRAAIRALTGWEPVTPGLVPTARWSQQDGIRALPEAVSGAYAVFAAQPGRSHPGRSEDA